MLSVPYEIENAGMLLREDISRLEIIRTVKWAARWHELIMGQ